MSGIPSGVWKEPLPSSSLVGRAAEAPARGDKGERFAGARTEGPRDCLEVLEGPDVPEEPFWAWGAGEGEGLGWDMCADADFV